MAFKKSTIKKQLDIEDGEAVEFLDVRLQFELNGETYEDIRTELHKRLDRRFNEMFAAELGVMPNRMEEGQRWKQLGLFDDAV